MLNLVPQSHRPVSLEALLERVERSLASPNSRRAYRIALLHFFTWCSDRPELPLARSTVLRYKDSLIAATASERRRFAPSTVNLRLAAIRALAQEAADENLLAQSEADAIRRVRGERSQGNPIGNWLQKPEVDRLLRSIDRSSLRGKRDYAMLALLFTCGLRRRELISLEVTTIQQRDAQWGLIGLKGKATKIRNISLPSWVKAAIDAWLEAAAISGGPIFRGITRHGKRGDSALSEESVKLILTPLAAALGHVNFRPHDARRTCARLCRNANASLEDVQELLGHSSIQTTERYLGKTDGFKRAITNLIAEPEAIPHTV